MANIKCNGTITATGDVYSNNKKVVNIDEVYPIGAVYISVNETSPASLFGGTWAAISAGYALWTTTTTGTGNTTIAAGLPNITGSVDHVASVAGISTSGCFSGTSDSGSSNSDGTGTDNMQINFSAANSNSIYGNSTTVQPPAYRVFAWRRTA